MQKKILIALGVAVVLFRLTALASTSDGLIDNANYTSVLLDNSSNLWQPGTANTEKIYWNTASPNAVHVTDSALTGYIWGPGVGWISLNCANTSSCASSDFKVLNNGEGVLSGYAWGETAGWISFSCANAETNNCAQNGNAKVTINSEGKFSGYAWSQNFGWIKFDCATSACVKTDWRAASIRNQNNNNSNGGGAVILATPPSTTTQATQQINVPSTPNTQVSEPQNPQPNAQPSNQPNNQPVINPIPKPSPVPGSFYPTTPPKPVDVYSYDLPLVVKPEQSARIEQNVSGYGLVVVEIAPNSVPNRITVVIDKEVKKQDYVNSQDQKKYGENGLIYYVYAKTDDGNLVHDFNKDIFITLPLPVEFQGKEIHIFRRGGSEKDWNKLPIQTLNKNNVVVASNRLGYFLMTQSTSFQPSAISAIQNFINRWWHVSLFALFTFFIIFFVVFHKRGSEHNEEDDENDLLF